VGVNFARKNNLRLVIKTTGHDLLGRSDGYGSLEIWLKYLRSGLQYSGSYNVAGNNWTGAAITVGGGMHVPSSEQRTSLTIRCQATHGTTYIHWPKPTMLLWLAAARLRSAYLEAGCKAVAMDQLPESMDSAQTSCCPRRSSSQMAPLSQPLQTRTR
jgi:hypothetical protein